MIEPLSTTPDTQVPDFAGIARKMADTTYPPEPWIPNYGHGHWFNGHFISDPHADERDGYASCITEQVTPRDEFIEELVEALAHMRAFSKLSRTEEVVYDENAAPIITKFTLHKIVDALQTKARDRGYDHG